MRRINAQVIKDAVADLAIQANLILRKDVLGKLRQAFAEETNTRARNILKAIISNANIARKEHIAICQDTGIPIVFLEVGQDVLIKGDLGLAVNKGIELGYKRGFLRNSIVSDPLTRSKAKFSPAVIHTALVKGRKIKITVLPKGFGCENKSQLKMFNPTAKQEEIKKFIVEAVKAAGPDACPPYFLGVGIGGSADYAMLLAKKALLRIVLRPSKLERELLKAINRLNIGPMGLGGKATCLGVNIETAATHIAGLPVAVNISCHALRSASVVL